MAENYGKNVEVPLYISMPVYDITGSEVVAVECHVCFALVKQSKIVEHLSTHANIQS